MGEGLGDGEGFTLVLDGCGVGFADNDGDEDLFGAVSGFEVRSGFTRGVEVGRGVRSASGVRATMRGVCCGVAAATRPLDAVLRDHIEVSFEPSGRPFWSSTISTFSPVSVQRP